MKRILAIDTCGALGSVELFDSVSGDVLGQETLPGRETQEKLLPTLQRVLADAGCPLAELFALAVITGPGSFTGVRIGLAAVKGLSEAAGVPVVALSRLAVLAAASPGRLHSTQHAWLDAGRGDVYSLMVAGNDRIQQGTEQLLSGEEARRCVREGDGIVVIEPELLEKLLDFTPTPSLVSQQDHRNSFRNLATEAAEAGSFADIALLDANYLRIPDAELALRSRGGLAAVPKPEATSCSV